MQPVDMSSTHWDHPECLNMMCADAFGWTNSSVPAHDHYLDRIFLDEGSSVVAAVCALLQPAHRLDHPG